MTLGKTGHYWRRFFGCSSDQDCDVGQICCDGDCKSAARPCVCEPECGPCGVCVDGACESACTQGQHCCENGCQSQPCSPPCDPPCVYPELCCSGECRIRCICDPDIHCVECDECGPKGYCLSTKCAPGESCCDGVCRTGGCANCVSSSDCPGGGACCDGNCCPPGEICCDNACCPDSPCCGCIDGVCVKQKRQAVMGNPPLTPVGNDPFRCHPDSGSDPTNCLCTLPSSWRIICRPSEDSSLVEGEVFVGPQCECGEFPQIKSWTSGKKRNEMTAFDYVFECVPEGSPGIDPNFYPGCIDPP